MDSVKQGTDALFILLGAIMVLALLMPDFFDETRGASVAMIAAAAALRAEAGMAPKLRVFSSGAIDEART